jgi:hypothetical protein
VKNNNGSFDLFGPQSTTMVGRTTFRMTAVQGGFRFPRALANCGRSSYRRRCVALRLRRHQRLPPGQRGRPALWRLNYAAAWRTLPRGRRSASRLVRIWAGRYTGLAVNITVVAGASDTLFLNKYPVIICLQLNAIDVRSSPRPPQTAAAHF